MGSMRIVSWNIQALRGASAAKLSSVATSIETHRADVAVLQEVASRGDVAVALQRELALIGLNHFWFSGRDEVREKRYGDKAYGNVIASRWPLEPRTWPVESEWPQLIISAEIGQSTGVLVVGVHIPNGSGNGWEKVFALEALAEGLQQARLPTVLAGDFNEPKLFHPEFLSFGVDRRGRLVGDFTDLHGVTHPRQRWQAAVEAVLSPTDSAWGGRHVSTQIGVEFEPTHIVGGRFERFFDHIMTAGPIRVSQVAYDHQVRLGNSPTSDHSMIVAELEL